MLITAQRWALVPGEVEMQQQALRHEGLIVARTRTLNLPAMELGGGSQPRERTWAWLVLEGEAHLRTRQGGQLVRAGEVFTDREDGAALLKTTPNAHLIQLVFASSESDCALPKGALCRATLDLSQRLAFSLAQTSPQNARANLRQIARALGLPDLERGLEPSVETKAEDARLAALVSRQSQALDAHPGVDDFASALGKNERRTSEVLGRYFRRYHASFRGWRAYLATLRVELALGLLCARPRARSEDIARWLGYRSSPAMYHALERRGLSPGAIRTD